MDPDRGGSWRHSAVRSAIVRSDDDRSSLELALVENLQRENLDALEEAMGLQHLIDEYGLTQEQLAQRIGKGRPTIANALRLLGLSDSIKAQLRTGAISASHAASAATDLPARSSMEACPRRSTPSRGERATA